MRKLLTACAVAVSVVPAAALAQSSVSISGILDIGVRADSGATGGTNYSVSSGQMFGSRLDFIGVEDLGGGLKAGFVLEAGIAMDTGAGTANPPAAVATDGLTFGRTAAVSIGSDKTGYLSFGRQYNPIWALSASGSNDPFAGSWLGGNAVVYSNTVLASNSIAYSYGYTERTMLRAAPVQGLGFAAIYALGEAAGGLPKNSGRQMGFNISYGAGPWFGGYAMHRVNGSSQALSGTAPVTDKPVLTQQTLSGAYNFGFLRLHAGLNRGKNDVVGAAAFSRRSWTLGATVPLAANQSLRVMVGQAKNKAAANADWDMVQVGYFYEFSKRTALYTAYGVIDNDPNAQTAFARSIGAFGRGSTPKAFIAGIRHFF